MYDITTVLAIIFDLVLATLVAGNNLSVCVGSAIASKVLSRRGGILLTVAGYVSGLLLQGESLGQTTSVLLPRGNLLALDIALGITILIFVIAHVRRVPQSLTVTLTTVLVGIDVALGYTKLGFMAKIIMFWVSMPILSFVFALVVMKRLSKGRPTRNIWSYIRLIKFAMIAASFFVAFTLGSNTLGLIYKLMPQIGSSPIGLSYQMLGIMAAMLVGALAFSGGELKRVGNDIIPLRYLNAVGALFISAFLVEIATIFGVPLSNTEAFTSSVYGTGVSYKSRVIRRQPFFIIVSLWVATALMGFAVGFVAMNAAGLL